MEKMRVLVRKPVAVVLLLALLGVTAHAASIVLFTSRDEYQSRVGPPQLTYNFSEFPDGPPDVPGQVALNGLTIRGDFTFSSGAMNFGPLGLASQAPLSFNFGGDVYAWGTDIVPFRGSGAMNISVGDLTAGFDVNAPGFIGFATDFPFRAMNATFVARPEIPQGSMSFLIDNVIANTVPEPSTLIILAAGAGLAGLYARRRKPAGNRRADGHEGGGSDRM